MAKSFILVRWIEEENLSVIPASAAHSSTGEVYVGVFGDFKWSGKYYEGEVLGVSGESLYVSMYLPWKLVVPRARVSKESPNQLPLFI